MSSPVPKKIKRTDPSVSRKERDPNVYQKDRVTGGYNGCEYEIKLAGLIWSKLKYNDEVEGFLLASNIKAAWPLDDICFKILWKDNKRKPTIVFIQAKHKINHENPNITLDKIFNGYRNIKNKFNDKEYGLFKGKFDECECYFILYTNEEFKFETVPATDYCPELNDVIGTGADGTVKRLSEREKEKLTTGLNKNDNDLSEYDKLICDRFFNSLLLFSRQANEEGVELILKRLTAPYQPSLENSFQVKSDAITAIYIREFVDWWKKLDQAPYLTEKNDILKNSFNKIIKNPLITSLNIIYKNKIKNNYTFSDDAVRFANLEDHSSTVIITENSVLTVVKVMQYLKNKNHVVLDLKCITSLQHAERKALCKELKTTENYVLILVCDEITENETFEDIGEAVMNKKRISISNNTKSSQNLKEFFPVGEGEVHKEVHDKRNRLTDLSEESQVNILETVTVTFQDKVVKLADIVDENSRKYVKGDVLHKIFIGKTIVFGKLIVKGNYDEIKHLYIDRPLRKTIPVSDTYKLFYSKYRPHLFKTLEDIEDDFVLVVGKPGMGKSTLLTHLSIKIIECNPHAWVIRINLLEYSKEFSKWKEDKTTIDTLETLKFMCQVILREKNSKTNKVEITLEGKNNVVSLEHCTADALTVFELNLFLHFYFEREIIFLIDGFDEIYPHYAEVVLKCLKTISNDPRRHRMWITSRSYNEIKTILEKEFKSSYEIDNFSNKEMAKYLKIFWEFHFTLKDLNCTQLDNVKKLLDYILTVSKRPIASIKEPLYLVSQNAALYLSNEIKKNTLILLRKYNENYHRDICELTETADAVIGSCMQCDNDDDDCISRIRNCANPLIIYLASVYVVHNIKTDNKMSDEWYLDVDPFTVYEKFLENKIKRRYEEKNGMNIYNPDIITAYEKELAGSILKHKQLGVYAIFNESFRREITPTVFTVWDSYFSIRFSDKEREEIKEMIKAVKKGEEKTGLIDSVTNGIPIFIHKTFAEYFAVEYICDCLKNENISQENIPLYLDMIFSNGICLTNVRKIFDHKLKIDKTLMGVLENNKNVIFKNIISYTHRPAFLGEKPPFRCEYLSRTATDDLPNFESFFDKTIDCGKRNAVMSDSENALLADLIRKQRLIKSQIKNYKQIQNHLFCIKK